MNPQDYENLVQLIGIENANKYLALIQERDERAVSQHRDSKISSRDDVTIQKGAPSLIEWAMGIGVKSAARPRSLVEYLTGGV